MKVKEESEKTGLKLNIQKTKIMASSPITSWEIDGETVETVSDFILGGSKITVDGDCNHEIKRCLLLGRIVMTNLDSILKSRDITLPMILYIANHKDSTRKLLELINEYSKVAVYKINTQKYLAFLYTNNEKIEREIKETQVLKDTSDEMDLIDIFRTFHPNAEYTFFSSAHGTFSRIEHTLGHKSSLSKFMKIEITSSVFSDHNAMRLDINFLKLTEI